MEKILLLTEEDYDINDISSFATSTKDEANIANADIVLVEHGNFYAILKSRTRNGYGNMILKSDFSNYVSGKEVKLYDAYVLRQEEIEEDIRKAEEKVLIENRTNTAKINFLNGIEIND